MARPTRRRQLLVDVSNIARRDSRTGIQRVVRAIACALQQLGGSGYEVRLVAADRRTSFRYLPNDWLERDAAGRELHLAAHSEVGVHRGDVFLGLDLNCSILPHHDRTLAAWRKQGVTVNLLLYDLLPKVQGRWFSARMRFNYLRWLRLVERRGDRVIAISQSVADEFAAWQARRRLWKGRSIDIETVELGSDISASLPSAGLPEDASRVLRWVRERPTVLMVGTIEPRKGHAQAIAAFEQLWATSPSSAPQLLVIGRTGWKTGHLQKQMRDLAQGCPRFLWLDAVSDEFLDELYRKAAGLLVASEAEGFGLPIVEALGHGCPVLARDIPVFRELSGPGIGFFDAHSPERLGGRIMEWFGEGNRGLQLRRTKKWRETAVDLTRILELDGAVAPQQASASHPIGSP